MIPKTETTDLYFGYGSNLDWQDWEKWCNEHGKDPNSIEALPGIYLLPDYELAFDYRSSGRRGGVLDVVKKRGHVVVGKLFKVSKQGFDALDEKEGVPVNVYEQKTVQVLGEDGKSHNVITYVVKKEEDEKEEHHTPNPEYVKIVLRGYDSHGITEKYPWAKKQLLESSLGHAVKSTANHIFTYGTLREGEERSHIIAEFSEKMYKDCKVHGDLISLGSYPGLIRTMTCKNCDEEIELDDDFVIGEVHHTPKIQNALKTLDQIEGFRGYGEKNSLFDRILVQCDDKLCWTYLWAGSSDDGTVIESGDWCKDD